MYRRNRVVVTGMGVIAPNGIGLDAYWKSLLEPKSAIGPITLFDASDFKSRIAGEVADFDPFDFIEPELKPKRMARHTQFAYAAAMMAAGVDARHLPVAGRADGADTAGGAQRRHEPPQMAFGVHQHP